LILRNVRLIPQLTVGFSGEFGDIVLENDRIKQISTAGSESGEGIDMAGKTALPGFIDGHVHLDLLGTDVWEENFQTDVTRAMRCLYRANASLRAGFTTLRDLGDRNGIVIDVAAAVDGGYVFGPDIIASGMILSPTESGNQYFKGMYLEADGCDEVQKGTRRLIQNGAKWIKYMGTGAYMNPGGEPGSAIYTQEEVDIIVKTANMYNIKVAGHNHGEVGILTAIKAGVRTIEHSTMMNDEIMNLVKGSDTTYLCPTLAPDAGWAKTIGLGNVPTFYATENQKKMSEGEYERYNKAYKMGLKLGFGSDAGVYQDSHGDNSLEFKARVSAAEMAPIDVLLQMTSINAEILMIDHEVGTIAPEKKANIVIIDGKPDINVGDIDKVAYVIKSGAICNF